MPAQRPSRGPLGLGRREAPAAPPSGSARERLLVASRPALRAIGALPRWALTGGLTLLLLVGLLGPRWVGVAALAVMVLVLGWLVGLQGLSGGRASVVLRLGSLVLLCAVFVMRVAGIA